MLTNFKVNLEEYKLIDQWRGPLISKLFFNKMEKLSKIAYSDMMENFEEDWRDFVGGALSLLNFFKFSLNIKKQYRKEINTFGKQIGDPKRLLYGNLSYEFAKIAESGMVDWCSSIAVPNNKYGMLHARNLDWPLNGLRGNSIAIDFHGSNAGPFTSITFPGFFGVLTGIAPDRFSASVNMMVENKGINIFGTPIAFIVREMFENCSTFYQAKRFLENASPFAPAFVHLVGILPNENCVVAVLPKGDENYLYESDSEALCVTNHLQDTDFDDEEWEVDSVERLGHAYEIADKILNFKSAQNEMRKEPLFNENTSQTIVMCAKTGNYTFK